MPKTHHILNAASNLLGITLLIIAGLHISDKAQRTFSDEIGWIGAVCFTVSCGLSYLAIRSEDGASRLEAWADKAFMLGMFALLGSVVVLAISHV